MNKTELIAAAAEKAGVSKKEAEAVVTAAFDAIAASLKEGEKVQLVGFGSFEVTPPPAPRSRSPLPRSRPSRPARRSRTSLADTPSKERVTPLLCFLPQAFPRKEHFPMRLDKYLKVSRLIKRRTVANEACDLGRITVNDRVARASYDVKVGDRIAIHFGERTLAVEVLSVADNVGKADAAALYRELPNN